MRINSTIAVLIFWSGMLLITCEDKSRLDTPDNPSGGDSDADGDGDGDDDNDGFDDDDNDDDDDNNQDSESAGIDGCEGVDFLFVLDNSGSMEDEQANLINSFPGFISAITEALDLDDYHIMVIDTDPAKNNGSSTMTCGSPGCCIEWCETNVNTSFAQCREDAADPFKLCGEWLGDDDAACNVILGAGHVGANINADCQLAEDHRYIVEGQPDLNGTFACIADVGVDGQGNEKPMEAMSQAVGPLAAPGECNEGFIREKAVLVVTFITDENDECTPDDQNGDECSAGDPVDWRQALVDAKDGNDKAIVVLGVFGDNDLPDGICEEYDQGGNGAEGSPRLREFLTSFDEDHRQYCSVCLESYASCFNEAVEDIVTTCDDDIIE